MTDTLTQIAALTATPDDADELTIPNPDGHGGVTITRKPRLVSDEHADWIKSAELPDGFKVDVSKGKKAEREQLASAADVSGDGAAGPAV